MHYTTNERTKRSQQLTDDGLNLVLIENCEWTRTTYSLHDKYFWRQSTRESVCNKQPACVFQIMHTCMLTLSLSRSPRVWCVQPACTMLCLCVRLVRAYGCECLRAFIKGIVKQTLNRRNGTELPISMCEWDGRMYDAACSLRCEHH